VPFIRSSRDKRGFDHTYVMHAYRAAGGAQRGRVLYLFRSPAGLKVGRQPLDAEVREALEHTHPDLTFDWAALARDSAAGRVDEREWDRGRDRARPPRPQPPAERRPAAAPEAPVDASLVARTLGGGAAGQLRTRYRDMVERVTRRARTVGERDALLARLSKLDPDAWPDAAGVKASAGMFEAEMKAIALALPSRRRGRRGGRDRDRGHDDARIPAVPGRGDDDAPPADEETVESPVPASAIIEGPGDENGTAERDAAAGVGDRTADAGDRDRGGPGGADAAPDPATDLPSRDEPHPSGRPGS
jgi:hypothetical protein